MRSVSASMSSALAFAAIALASLGASSSCASNPPASRPVDVEVPIRCAEGYVVHEVYLDGRGPYWCALDTGNAQTLVFERVARELGLETEALGEMGGAGPGAIEVRSARGVRVSVRGAGGEVTFEEPTTIVLPDAATLPDLEGKRIDVFLGATLIERYATTIDYPRERLRFQSHGSCAPPEGAKVLSIGLTHGFPHFAGRVVAERAGEAADAIEGNFLLDLGAAYGVQVDHGPAEARGLLDGEDAARRPEGTVMGIDGQSMDILSVPARSVEMGGVALDEARVLLLPVHGGGPPIEDLVGNVGSGCFRSGALTLDYPGRRVVFVASP